MAKPITNLLKRALKKVEKGWEHHDYATNKDGMSVDPTSPKACRWCCYGALQAVEPEGTRRHDAMRGYLKQVIPKGYSGIGGWNNARGRTKAQVLAAFKRAIKLAEKAGA